MDQKPERKSRRYHRLMWMWCGVVIGGVVATSAVTQGLNIRGVHAQGPLPSTSVVPAAYSGPGYGGPKSSYRLYFQASPAQDRFAPPGPGEATNTPLPTATRTPLPTATQVKNLPPTATPEGYGKPRG